MKKIYIAAYHQSRFGKLMGMNVPEILHRAVEAEHLGEDQDRGLAAAVRRRDEGSIRAPRFAREFDRLRSDHAWLPPLPAPDAANRR